MCCRRGADSTVRDLLASCCARAGLQPEKERRELLLPQRPDDCGVQRRRPAEITCLACRALLLHWTWPSLAFSGTRPSPRPAKQVVARRQPMLPSSPPIKTRPSCVRNRTSTSSLLLPKLLALGMRLLPKFSARSPVRQPPVKAPRLSYRACLRVSVPATLRLRWPQPPSQMRLSCLHLSLCLSPCLDILGRRILSLVVFLLLSPFLLHLSPLVPLLVFLVASLVSLLVPPRAES